MRSKAFAEERTRKVVLGFSSKGYPVSRPQGSPIALTDGDPGFTDNPSRSSPVRQKKDDPWPAAAVPVDESILIDPQFFRKIASGPDSRLLHTDLGSRTFSDPSQADSRPRKKKS